MYSTTLFSFALYFFVLLVIGFISHKKHCSEADFVIGGRELNPWVTALSAHASDMSSWLFMGFPMAVYIGGPQMGWIAVGLILGMFCCWTFLAQGIREETEKYGSLTLSSYIEAKTRNQKKKTHTIRILCAIMTLLFMLHYLAAGLTGMGFILEGIFGMNYYWGCFGAMAIIALYTTYGGFITVAWTDLFQALFLLSVLIIVPFVALQEIGGWQPVQQQLQAHFADPLSISSSHIIHICLLLFGWGLGYFGQPHIITKFMGLKNPKQMRYCRAIGITWQVLALGSAFLCALIATAYHKTPLANNELVFVEMVQGLFSPVIAGIILSAILAATISTMDSQIIVCAAVLSEDLAPLLQKQKTQVGKSRIAVLVVSALAFVIALDKSHTVMDMVSYSWVGLGCSFGPVLLSCLYYPMINEKGAIAGMLTGGVFSAFAPSLLLSTEQPVAYLMVPGFILSTLAIITTSKLTETNKNLA